ncbi:MAG: hypothetical protein ABUK01_19165 [Leptospirales bacterium]
MDLKPKEFAIGIWLWKSLRKWQIRNKRNNIIALVIGFLSILIINPKTSSHLHANQSQQYLIFQQKFLLKDFNKDKVNLKYCHFKKTKHLLNPLNYIKDIMFYGANCKNRIDMSKNHDEIWLVVYDKISRKPLAWTVIDYISIDRVLATYKDDRIVGLAIEEHARKNDNKWERITQATLKLENGIFIISNLFYETENSRDKNCNFQHEFEYRCRNQSVFYVRSDKKYIVISKFVRKKRIYVITYTYEGKFIQFSGDKEDYYNESVYIGWIGYTWLLREEINKNTK